MRADAPAGTSRPPRRPLPALVEETSPFWTRGEHGELVVKTCSECERLSHPSSQLCPDCPQGELRWITVSGRANIVALTVNHQAWIPAMPPPYVVAIVALVEDPRVRLTTNIVHLAEDQDARIGDPVTVTFEKLEDVWLPVFGPDPAGSIVVDGIEEPKAFVRPPASAERFEHRITLTGIGMSEIGRRLLRSPVSLAAEACLAAIADAGLTVADIDGLSTYPGGPANGFSEGGTPALIDALGISPTWHSGGPETSGQTGSVVNAMLAVATGLCRHVLCFRTVTESTHTHQVRQGVRPRTGAGRLEGDLLTWRAPFGATSAANWIAMAASQYRHRYGLDRETLGRIALNARSNAALNDAAIYREPLTMQDYLDARMITTPFGLYDCDVPCDGAVAVVVSHRAAGVDCPNGAVHVAAVGTGISERQSWDQGTITHEPNVFGAATHLWSRTDLTPDDVDVAELYDGFTFNCLTWLEALGFCPVGQAGDFIGDGRSIARDGSLPLNTHGGQLSAGRTHGYGFLHEAIVQLRGTAGKRQVPDAEVAVVASGGGTPGGCLLLTRS